MYSLDFIDFYKKIFKNRLQNLKIRFSLDFFKISLDFIDFFKRFENSKIFKIFRLHPQIMKIHDFCDLAKQSDFIQICTVMENHEYLSVMCRLKSGEFNYLRLERFGVVLRIFERFENSKISKISEF